jgi:hypothetical protein
MYALIALSISGEGIIFGMMQGVFTPTAKADMLMVYAWHDAAGLP